MPSLDEIFTLPDDQTTLRQPALDVDRVARFAE